VTTSTARPLLGTRGARTVAFALGGTGVLALAASTALVVQTLATGSVTAAAALTEPSRVQLGEGLDLPPDLGLTGDHVAVQVIADGLPAGTGLLVALGTVLPWLCAGLAALALGRVAWGLHRGAPFRPAHARLLVAVAGLWGVGSYGTPWVVHLASVQVLAHAGSPSTLEPAADSGSLLVTWLGLVVLLAVAEVFRRGARQARDVDGLV
jgi:hypothetical protein